MPVITWKTHKIDAGYEWTVYSFGYQIPTVTLKSGTARTREIATRLGKQWKMYLTARQRKDGWAPLTPAEAADAHRRDASGFVNVEHD